MARSDKSARTAAAPSGPPPWFGDLDQADFDIDFFERVVQRSPRFVLALRVLGELLARKGCYDRSVAIDRRLVEMLPEDCLVRYNLACSLAMAGLRREAISELRRAIDHGYNDFGYLEVDSDLDSLRNDPAFQSLLKKRTTGQKRRK